MWLEGFSVIENVYENTISANKGSFMVIFMRFNCFPSLFRWKIFYQWMVSNKFISWNSNFYRFRSLFLRSNFIWHEWNWPNDEHNTLYRSNVYRFFAPLLVVDSKKWENFNWIQLDCIVNLRVQTKIFCAVCFFCLIKEKTIIFAHFPSNPILIWPKLRPMAWKIHTEIFS